MEWIKKSLSKVNKTLLIMTIVFFGFGLIMILSASSMESYMRHGNSPYFYFFRQLIFLIGGIFIFVFIMLFPTKNYGKYENTLAYGSVALLIFVKLFGKVVNNSRSWLDLSVISIQPSEFVKIALILYMAIYYGKRYKKLNSQWNIIKPLIFAAIMVGLVILQPDLGTAIIIALLSIILFYGVPIESSKRNIITKIIVGFVLITISVLVITKGSFLRDYQKERFNFIKPCERYQEESGYQLCNSFIAFYNGGLTGKGLGESTQKYLYLPESYTDFIFPIIVEEWGMIIGILIIICYIVLLFVILNIAKKATTVQNGLIAYGTFIYICLHIVINLIGVMGLGPLTGVPLPFLSYGGSYALSLLIALALVQRVAIETNINKDKKVK